MGQTELGQTTSCIVYPHSMKHVSTLAWPRNPAHDEETGRALGTQGHFFRMCRAQPPSSSGMPNGELIVGFDDARGMSVKAIDLGQVFPATMLVTVDIVRCWRAKSNCREDPSFFLVGLNVLSVLMGKFKFAPCASFWGEHPPLLAGNTSSRPGTRPLRHPRRLCL